MDAIEKINTEMQKSPDDAYMEVIGQYIIDRCADPACRQKVEPAEKTLQGAMKAVMDVAETKKKGRVAVLVPSQVFGAVDTYFGFPQDLAAQREAIEGAFGGTASARPKTDGNILKLEDFF